MRRRVETWKVIAAWLHRSVRWTRKQASSRRPESLRLPVYRSASGRPVYAYVDELEDWQVRTELKVVTSD